MIAVHHRVSVQTHAGFATRTFGRPGTYGRLTREVLNSLSLAHSDDFRRDSDLFPSACATRRRNAGCGSPRSAGFRHMGMNWTDEMLGERTAR